MRLSITLLLLTISGSMFAQSGTRPKNSDIENIGNRDINKGQINFMSYEHEIEMGRRLAAEIEKTVTLFGDSEVNRYIDQLGQRLARNSDLKIPLTIKVIDSNAVNTLALPGGFVYANTGLIKTADNEAELAFAIAYSIAHIAAHHASEQAAKGQMINIAAVPLMFLGGPAGNTLRQVPGAKTSFSPAAFLSFARAGVLEADYLGIQYTFKAGYDPSAAVTLLTRIKDQEDSGMPPAASIAREFRTHPPTADRIAAIKKNIGLLFPNIPAGLALGPDFASIKARIPQ